jgi:hypothetical protein
MASLRTARLGLAEQRRLLERRIDREVLIACRNSMSELNLRPARAPARGIPDRTRTVLASLRAHFAPAAGPAARRNP